MGTRSGDLDPAIITFIAEEGISAQEVINICNNSSVLGLSWTFHDFRDLAMA